MNYRSLSLTFLLLLLSFDGFTRTSIVCNSCEFTDLNHAIDRSNRFDTIIIKSGTYKALNIEIHKPITILGEENSILDGELAGYVLKILGDSVTISGITIINSGRSYTKDYAAIYTFKANHFKITNCKIIDPFFGILVEKSKHGLISGNLVYGVSSKEDDSGNGIHAWHCSDITIKNNEVYKMRDGIYMEFVG